MGPRGLVVGLALLAVAAAGCGAAGHPSTVAAPAVAREICVDLVEGAHESEQLVATMDYESAESAAQGTRWQTVFATADEQVNLGNRAEAAATVHSALDGPCLSAGASIADISFYT